MNTPTLALEAERIKAITLLGLASNLVLAGVKFGVGLVVNSLALIADAFNSLTDIITDVAVIWGSRWGAKPPDEDHPFGHGKIETFISAIVISGIIAVGVALVITAVKTLIVGREKAVLGLPIVGVAILTIAIKEYLYRRTLVVARQVRSIALKAKAWDHRGDVVVGLVVLSGGLGTVLHWLPADTIAGLIVGVIILTVGFRLGKEVVVELSEGAVDQETITQLNSILHSIPEVRGWHKLRTRRIGRELLMDVHILMDPQLTVEEAHRIVRDIEQALRSGTSWPVDPLIHVDPDNDEIRAKRERAGDKTLKPKL